MYRLAEEVARKIIRNIRSPEIGPMDITQKDPFMPKNIHSVGIVDPYCAIGTAFDYVLEVPYPYINISLPRLDVLDGFWLYKREELLQPMEPLLVPRYLADPNIREAETELDVTDCSISVADDIHKLTCISIMDFATLIKYEPLVLDCLNKDLK